MLALIAGFDGPTARRLSSYLMILMKGAIITALVQGDLDAGRQAGEVAAILIDRVDGTVGVVEEPIIIEVADVLRAEPVVSEVAAGRLSGPSLPGRGHRGRRPWFPAYPLQAALGSARYYGM